MSPKKAAQKPAKGTTATGKTSKGFSDFERAAMKERAQELKAEAEKADGESAVLAKIAEMQGSERAMAKRLHAIIKASAPALAPKTWYGMPAYAKDGKVVCFFQSAAEIQIKVRHVRLQRRGKARRRRHVADLLRAEGIDRRRRGKDRRAGEESGELKTGLATEPRQRVSRSTRKAGDLILLASSQDAVAARQFFVPAEFRGATRRAGSRQHAL